jgi:hypothetical protein
MNTNSLGRLETVDLREVWPAEDDDFTPWLELPENLKLLGEAIGLDLEIETREKSVGPFRADLVCKELDNGRTVVIENQFGESDHDHLGKILTYAAGLKAEISIWIARHFIDEHRAAPDWLNEKASGGTSFFGVEMEAWRIGDSKPAPKFNIISKPNDWSNSLKQAGIAGGLTETERLRIDFWTELIAYLKSANSSIRCHSPGPFQFLRAQSQKSPLPFRCGFSIYVRPPSVGAYLGSDKEPHVGGLSRVFRKHQAEIEGEVGEKIDWNPSEGEFWISANRDDDSTNRNHWPRQHQWMRGVFEKLTGAVSKYLVAVPGGEPES